jgi:hypothetical protein
MSSGTSAAALDKIIAQEPGKFWNSTRWGEAMQKIAREALRGTGVKDE